MRKRMFLATGATVAIGCAVLIVLAMLPPRPGVTKANFDRIEKGMTEAEVNQILGRPGDEWNFALLWKANDGSCGVVWFTDNCVAETSWVESDKSFLDKIRHWLHL